MAELPTLLPLADVIRITGVSRASIYRGIAAGVFPRPVQITLRRVGWRSDDLRELMTANRPAG